jgi:MFS family permease
MFWSGTSFLLTSAVFQPNIGQFSTIFGRKPVLLFCLTLFGVGAIVAGIANNMTNVLVGRTIQGIGGGGVIVLSEILITDLIPLRQRGKWTGHLSMMWSLGTIAGPLAGGAFAQAGASGWRWIFYLNLPFLGIGVILILWFLRLSFPVSSFSSKLQRVDWFGSFLFIASTTGFLIPVTWGGTQYPWGSWRTLVPLILCGLGLVGFVVYEEYVPSEPLIRMTVFKNRTAAAVFLQNFIHGIVLWGVLFYMPLYYQAVKGMSPIMSGVALLPLSFTVAPAAAFTGITVARTGLYRWAIYSGWFLTAFGTGLLLVLDVHTSTGSWIVLTLIGGLGFGILFPSMAIAVQAASSAEIQAYAATTFTLIRALGQTVGVAVGGAIFQSSVRRRLLTFPELAARSNELSKDATALVKVISSMPDNLERQHLRESFVYGLRFVWMVMCILATVALLSTFFVKSLALDRKLKTDQTFQYDNEGSDRETELAAVPPHHSSQAKQSINVDSQQPVVARSILE